jgi:hypothetical protein
MPSAAAAKNLLAAFADLQRDVRTSSRIHAGNAVKLDVARTSVLRYLAVLNQVRIFLQYPALTYFLHPCTSCSTHRHFLPNKILMYAAI